MKAHLTLLAVALLLGACTHPAPRPGSGLPTPHAWQSATAQASSQDNRQWWQGFSSPRLNQLIAQAQQGSYDVAAATARVRQAQAQAVIAGAALLPQLDADLKAGRSKLIHGNRGDDSRSASANSFSANLSASYEVDFWGANAAVRDSALSRVQASEFDHATVELTLLSSVADRYAQVLAAREQQQIAALNLANAHSVLNLVQTRYNSGSATALELAQQNSLVAAQQRQLPQLHQQAEDARITLAALLGQPVQSLGADSETFAHLSWPGIDAGMPSDLLTRRPDIARAEALLAAAQGDVRVARAALLPKLTLGASLGSSADHAADTLRNPLYSLTSGLVAPVFNNGRLRAERDHASAVQDELLQSYRGAIINGLADVEKALNSIDGLDQQRQWQEEELRQAQSAFRIAQSRYQAGAEDLLTVLDAQRTLYSAQDFNVQLRLQRMQASIALYKALGGGWRKYDTNL